MGFFFPDAGKSTKRSNKKIPLHTARELECKVCPRAKLKGFSPKMEAQGSAKPLIYMLRGELTKEEDKFGDHLSDPAGEFLLQQYGPHWDELIRYNNVLRCYSSKPPDEIELECCKNYFEKDIEETKPEVIIGVGPLPLAWQFGTANVIKWRRRLIPVQVGTHVCWYYALIDPDYVLGKRRFNKKTGKRDIKTEYDHIFEKDMEYILNLVENNLLEKPKIYDNYYEGIEWTEGKQSDKELNKILNWLKEFTDLEGPHAIDIETNGLRPYIENSKILTVSIGKYDRTVAFPIHYPGAWTKKQLDILEKAFQHYLLNSATKIGHNTKFELEWLTFEKFYGGELLTGTNWGDTQGQAYVIDERRGMMSLDILVRLYFGFNLKSLSNLDLTRLIEYPLSKILPYNGLDTKWTHKLYLEQQKKLKAEPTLLRVYNELCKALPTLTKCQQIGIPVDYELRDEIEKKLTKEIQGIELDLKDSPEVIDYESRYGPYNPESPHNLMRLLKEVVGLDNELRTKEGGYTTSEDVLSKLKDVPIAPLTLRYRAIKKKKGTYITPLIEHCYHSDGRLHTNFNLYETATGRLSSNNPNMQNWPNRKGKEIRRLIIPPENHWIVSADYGQIEARIIGVASQDNNFCDALWHDLDIHMDWAIKIAEEYPQVVGGSHNIDNLEKMKKFRKDVKNQWTFPAFYGASPYSIARALAVPIDIVLDLFTEFWDTFKGVKKWQDWVQNFYNKHGYVETLTGRRRYGPLAMNKIINTPIQGTASDICVNAMNRLTDAGIQVVMNIHDDVTSFVPDDELEEQVEFIAQEMCCVPYKWINVPIAVEVEVGENWCDQEEVGTFTSTEFMKVEKNLRRIEDYKDLQ